MHCVLTILSKLRKAGILKLFSCFKLVQLGPTKILTKCHSHNFTYMFRCIKTMKLTRYNSMHITLDENRLFSVLSPNILNPWLSESRQCWHCKAKQVKFVCIKCHSLLLLLWHILKNWLTQQQPCEGNPSWETLLQSRLSWNLQGAWQVKIVDFSKSPPFHFYLATEMVMSWSQ